MQRMSDSPSGKTVPIGNGQMAFIPNPLPRDLPLSSNLILLLDNASRAVATLAGVGETVPNPHMLAQPFIRREAVLCTSGVLATPLLYLSAYFERDRQRYYDELLNVSVTGDWERWLSYFLDGVYQESRDVLERIRRVRNLQEEWRELLLNRGEPSSGLRLLEDLFVHPVTTAPRVSQLLEISDPGARRVLDRLIDAGIVNRIGISRPSLYVAQRLIEEIERPIEPMDDDKPLRLRLS